MCKLIRICPRESFCNQCIIQSYRMYNIIIIISELSTNEMNLVSANNCDDHINILIIARVTYTYIYISLENNRTLY